MEAPVWLNRRPFMNRTLLQATKPLPTVFVRHILGSQIGHYRRVEYPWPLTACCIALAPASKLVSICVIDRVASRLVAWGSSMLSSGLSMGRYIGRPTGIHAATNKSNKLRAETRR